MSRLLNLLPKAWPFIDLPGYRETSPYSTYSSFAYESLPPVEAKADDRFDWLRAEPPHTDDALWQDTSPSTHQYLARLSASEYQEWLLWKDATSPERLISAIETAGEFSLPAPFVAFLRSPSLQSRIRSGTACYLQMPNTVVQTYGVESGRLIHFLSDQQWCLHWNLYLGPDNEQCVLCSVNDYGFEESSQPIDLTQEKVAYCAPSFTQFLYRFWLENEVWFALTDGVPLTADQQAYVDHYRSQPGLAANFEVILDSWGREKSL